MSEKGQLESAVAQQTIVAMKARDQVRTGTLRLITNALKNKAIEKREMLTPAEEQQTLASMIKQRRDSIEQFTAGNRPELAAIEAAGLEVVEASPAKPAVLFGGVPVSFHTIGEVGLIELIHGEPR